jgi:hypothetical protein
VIDGGAGNDVITGGIGDDSIDGGDGIDAAKFTDNARDYDIAIVDGRMVVHDRIGGRDGSDHLTNLEVLQFADGAIDAGNLLAILSNSSGSTLQVLAIDAAGKIIGQLLRHADGSDLYSFETTGNPASQQPVDSDGASENARPDVAGHILGFLKSFSGDARDQLVFDNHEGSPIVRAHAAGVTLISTAVSDIPNIAGSDTFIFSETVGHGAVGGMKASEAVGHDVSQMEATIAAGVAHPPVDVAGHDPIIDPGHDASITLAGVTSLTADHLLFI